MPNKVSRARGFTVVELLVVISIIGILLALFLPAVQSARESSRSGECKNNLRQIALAFLGHESVHRQLPTGGWGHAWQGDPDRGFGRQQPGGWVYNVLPYLEHEALRQMGAGESASAKRATGRAVAETALTMFNCPSRRAATAYPFVHLENFCNIDRPERVARTDYAANVGDLMPRLYGRGPASLTEGDAPQYAWTQLNRTGIVFRRSELRLSDVIDGSSQTYMLGEGYLNTDHYTDGLGVNDDQGMYVGYDRDTLRCTHPAWPPLRDRMGVDSDHSFGSVHAGGFHVALCDGSVRRVPYDVSAIVHRALGNRKDGRAVSFGNL